MHRITIERNGETLETISLSLTMSQANEEHEGWGKITSHREMHGIEDAIWYFTNEDEMIAQDLPTAEVEHAAGMTHLTFNCDNDCDEDLEGYRMAIAFFSRKMGLEPEFTFNFEIGRIVASYKH